MTAGDDTTHRQIGDSEDGDRHGREAAKAPQDFSIRSMVAADWPAVRAIYEMGIATGDATFETSAPEWDSWNESHMQNHRFVADASSEVVGWVALSPISDRCVYGGVAENSVYVHPAWHGRGVGRSLLNAVIADAEAAGIWTIQTGVFPENVASLNLPQNVGFRQVGWRERIGQLGGIWRDTILLERRSNIVGR
jgi:L-amino acid N-acyltransferase YncA